MVTRLSMKCLISTCMHVRSSIFLWIRLEKMKLNFVRPIYAKDGISIKIVVMMLDCQNRNQILNAICEHDLFLLS